MFHLLESFHILFGLSMPFTKPWCSVQRHFAPSLQFLILTSFFPYGNTAMYTSKFMPGKSLRSLYFFRLSSQHSQWGLSHSPSCNVSAYKNFTFGTHSSRSIHTIIDWNESEIITDRKSRFQARHTDLHDANDITSILAQFLAQHKSIAKNASHPHILAWRTGTPVEKSLRSEIKQRKGRKANENSSPMQAYTNIQQGFKDNGEKGAGAKLLEHLVNENVMNKLVIVTRWYGGSPIGSLRFRHISNCAFDSLRKGR